MDIRNGFVRPYYIRNIEVNINIAVLDQAKTASFTMSQEFLTHLYFHHAGNHILGAKARNPYFFFGGLDRGAISGIA